MKKTGVTARGIICPIIRKGDDLVEIVASSVISAAEEEGFELQPRDIVCVTESIVARAQGNYAKTEDITQDVLDKFGSGQEIGLVYPIYSRNRFAVCLRGIARAAKKLYIQFPKKTDEVGNPLEHPITGVNYMDYYGEICKEAGCDVEFLISDSPKDILRYTGNIIVASIHTRGKIRSGLEKTKTTGQPKIYTLSDILCTPSLDHGFNTEFGLLGSNKVDEETIKLFPRDCMEFVKNLQHELQEKTGHKLEVGIYGDGEFKSAYDKNGISIWEFADPVCMPGFTDGLQGTPSEVKIKYLADDKYKNLSGEELQEKIQEEIREKEQDLTGNMKSQGTTPRRFTDLIGSLCDLISGSGDKGTPVVLIQNYFSNYAE